MGEAIQTLATYPSSGTNWPYALAQLYKGSCHAPLPKDKHLGILPQGKAEETSHVGWISQLDVCQLLFAGPPSSLSYRFEWTRLTHYNYSTRTAKQWYKHYHH